MTAKPQKNIPNEVITERIEQISAPAGTSKLSEFPWQGVGWKLLACLCFAVINVSVRYINGGAGGASSPLPSSQIVFLQYAFGLAFMMPWLFNLGIKALKSNYLKLHMLRVCAAVTGVVLWYMSLQHMPIAEVIALSFTNPIFTIIGAKLYLKEPIGKARLAGITLGFVGAFTILRPDKVLLSETASYDWHILLPLCSAASFAMNKLYSRRLAAAGESVGTLAIYIMLFMAPIALVPAWYEWTTPTPSQWYWMAALGAAATLAQLAIARALQLADISLLNPFGFARFVFSAALGYVAFSEWPQSASWWLGMTIIIAGLYCLSLDARARSRSIEF